MRTVLLIMCLVLAVNVQPARAQSEITEPTDQNNATIVSFIVRGSLYAHGDAAYQLPLSILESLERQTHLNTLSVNGDDGGQEAGAQFEARFTFNDLKSFREWYAHKDTQNLLTQLKGTHSPSLLRYDLHVQRMPLAMKDNP